jgi:electron transfer flavoprotein alpha/beta subunit
LIVLVCLESPTPSRASRAALGLAQGLGGAWQIVAIAAGGPDKGAWLDLARQSGAHRILHVGDAHLGHPDFLTLGMVLAETARYSEASLILTGEHSDGEGQGLVPAALAHHLHAPIMSHIEAVEPSAEMATAVVATTFADGRHIRFELAMPVVLSVSPSAAVPPGTEALPDATQTAVESLTLTQLGLDQSRIVPRPDLLGTRVPLAAVKARPVSVDEAAAILLRAT